MDFRAIENCTIPMKDFVLKWRFTDPKYRLIDEVYLNKMKPISKEGALKFDAYVNDIQLHSDFPFRKGLFKSIDQIMILEVNEIDIREWLKNKNIDPRKEVYLSWNSEEAMIIPFEVLIKFYDELFYGGSDDLTIIDESLNWFFLFHHDEIVYFATV